MRFFLDKIFSGRKVKVVKRKCQHDSWRRLYIRLLTKPIEPWTDLTPEHRLELEGIEDLIDAGYMRGKVHPDTTGIPQWASIRGATLKGRIFAEEQQDILDSKSLWGRVKTGSTLFAGWLAGIISALIIWRLTKSR